jgi:hypothetical protein
MPSEAVDVDVGQLVGRRLKDCPVESEPGRARPSRWAGHELARSAAVRVVRPNGSGSFGSAPGSRTGSPQQPEVAKSAKARDGVALGKQSEGDQPDVAATRWALERKLLPNLGHEFRPGNPGGVVRAGLLIRVAAAFRGVTAAPMPAASGLAPLADIPDRERRDGPPQLVIRRKHPVITMPVLPRRRHEIGQPVEELGAA